MRSEPAPVAYAVAKAEASRTLSAALDAEGVDQIEIAAAVGVNRSLVQRWTAPSESASLTVAAVHVIARRGYPQVARRIVASLAETLGLRVEEREGAAPARSWLTALGTITDRAHAVQSALIGAMAPSSEGGEDISDDELELIEARIAEAERSLSEARSLAHAERQRREGGEVVSIAGRR